MHVNFFVFCHQANKQTNVRQKMFHFLPSLMSNISDSRQNIKNLVHNLGDIKMKNLISKFGLSN